ncbi:hypothetical protein AB6A40_008016 [Gnathostoma spinigerum]|uniref:Ubiquitin carboxyl-terminal hydrolase n=1 Tax=Gnathostoma spinigerum TaxID=75299 RepID=A0ABD6EXJ1_9BILA
MSDSIRWLPLESNPETINSFLRKMGVEKGVECVDVLGFDDDLLAMLPRPHYALILCFPDYKKVHEIMHSVYGQLEKKGVGVPPDVFFMKQKISNACGTFALLHSLVNNKTRINLGDGSLKKWMDKAVELDVNDRSDSLANDSELANAHEDCARSGDTEAEPAEDVEHHFICYVIVNGTLYEIDSSQNFPRDCGKSTEETFMKDAGKVCRELMSKMDNISFSALALVRS